MQACVLGEPVHGNQGEDIKQYLERMERVIAQAEEIHSSTVVHTRSASRRHSFNRSQLSYSGMADDRAMHSGKRSPLRRSYGSSAEEQVSSGAVSMAAGAEAQSTISPCAEHKTNGLHTSADIASNGNLQLNITAGLSNWMAGNTAAPPQTALPASRNTTEQPTQPPAIVHCEDVQVVDGRCVQQSVVLATPPRGTSPVP
jgi:hypothetical protein